MPHTESIRETQQQGTKCYDEQMFFFNNAMKTDMIMGYMAYLPPVECGQQAGADVVILGRPPLYAPSRVALLSPPTFP